MRQPAALDRRLLRPKLPNRPHPPDSACLGEQLGVVLGVVPVMPAEREALEHQVEHYGDATAWNIRPHTQVSNRSAYRSGADLILLEFIIQTHVY